MTTSICQKHNLERTKSRSCPQCKLEYQRKWVSKNREKVRETNTNWKKENKEKVNEITRSYSKKNRASETERNSIWYNKNPYADCFVRRAICLLKTSIYLKLKAVDIPIELVEIKRLQMQLTHATKAANQ